MAEHKDAELEIYRNLIEQPDEFVDGFDIKTIVGALFLGLLITPGSLYIMLVAGEAVGPAARWVTIFLFAEVAKRSLKELKQQEVFVLYYMTTAVLATNSGILWNIYMVQSEAFQAMGITQQIPHWVVPSAEVLAREGRNLFIPEWLPAIGVFSLTMIVTRLDNFGLGYFLYRLTSDVEKLPFPMAPVGASGILAMAETKDKTMQWRPATFAIGGVLGLMFGLVYLALPEISGVFLREPIRIIPIPWIEMTPTFEDIFPATAVNIVPNLSLVLMGMVLPFWAVVGGFLGLIFTFVLNPQLYKLSILHHWEPGMKTVDTLFANTIDFYFSFGLGITFFIVFLGFWQAFAAMRKAKKRNSESAESLTPEMGRWETLKRGNPARGDISIWMSLFLYVASTTAYLSISTWLVPDFPWPIFLIYGFIYTPLVSYAAAKIEGMAGQSLAIPMVKEATFILSGYRGVAIWYAPIPLHNYGYVTKEFRQIELTGTRLTSVIKTDIVTLPILIASLVIFSGVIWSQADLNSDQYPHVQQVWDLQSRNQALIISSTMEGKRSLFFEALRGDYIGVGFAVAGLLYAALSAFGLPVMLIYGLVRGLGQTNPAGLVPELIGAMIGRFYFQRKFGDMWLRYTPCIFAGFSCGVGLMGMMAVGIKLISKSILPNVY